MGKEVIKTQDSTAETPALRPDEVKKLRVEDKLMGAGQAVHAAYDIVRVNSVGEYYWKEHDQHLYRLLDDHQLEIWVRDFWRAAYGAFKPKDITDGINMVKLLTEREVDSLSADCIMISDGLYWNKDKGEVVRTPSGPVFYRLFDTSVETKHVVRVEAFNSEQEESFLKRYEQVKAELQRGEEVERYEFLKTWADGSHDVYMDLHRAHAYMFLEKKPLGAYILIGIKRNGKSSYVGLTHTIAGKNNTSDVQLTQLGDPHYTHKLRKTLVNAPDEERDQAVNAQDFFKSMADHATLSLPVMRSNIPVTLNCDFMCFFPMNHIPEWKGSGASACLERSLVISFNADLSQFDKKSVNFAKETFTADTMADYLGSVFAYAWWYHRHDLEFSETMITERGVLEQDIDSCLTYYKHFVKYFDGFENFKSVYEDYQYWCQTQDVKINSRKELKFVFRNICNSPTSYRYKGEPRRIYRVAQSGKQPLMLDFSCPEVEPWDILLEKHCSVIHQLDLFYETKDVA